MRYFRKTPLLLATLLSAGCSGGGTVSPISTTAPTVVSGVAARDLMNSGTVTLYEANNDGSNGIVLGSTPLNTDGTWSYTLSSTYGAALRVTVAGGTYTSEFDGTAESTNTSISALLVNPDDVPPTVAVTPLSTFVDSYTTAQAGNGTNLATAHQAATSLILGAYGFATDDVAEALVPNVAANATADNLRTAAVLGALEAEARALGASDRGTLVTALALDLSDGVFNGQDSTGAAVPFGSGTLPANAGTTLFLSALQSYAAAAPQVAAAATSIAQTLPGSPVAANVTTPVTVQTRTLSWTVPFAFSAGINASVELEAQQDTANGTLPDQTVTIGNASTFTETSTNQTLTLSSVNASASLINGTIELFFQGTFSDGTAVTTSGYNVVDGTVLPLFLQLDNTATIEAGNAIAASGANVSWTAAPVTTGD